MDGSPMNRLPQDTLLLIFSCLPLRDIIACRSVCKSFNQTLTSSSFMDLISTRPPLHLLTLRPPLHHHHHRRLHPSFHPSLHVYDPYQTKWLRFSLDFLPFRSPHPVASAGGLVYLWGDSMNSTESNKSLVVCNPLTRKYRVLPQLGSAWSRHGSVLVDSVNRIMVLTELAALYFSGSSNKWLKFSWNFPSKPRSPILISNSVYALCDVGYPWRSRWKLFSCSLDTSSDQHHNWVCLEKPQWGDIFDIIKRPRLVRGSSSKKILMIGGLKSTLSLNPECSTVLILKLDLDILEWEEAARMPVDMYKRFQESTKFKVFGGGDKVCFFANRVGRLALWDSGESWSWIDEMPGNEDGFSRGFVFEAQLHALP